MHVLAVEHVVYDLDDYEERWGYVYNMFHRQYMHAMLKDSALGDNVSTCSVSSCPRDKHTRWFTLRVAGAPSPSPSAGI
jgi:hypothetical protein